MKTKSILALIVLMMCIGALPTYAAGSVGNMQGTAIPKGSVSSGTFYGGHRTEAAIDGDASTYWNAGNTTGTIQVTFPSSINITKIQLASVASGKSNVSYTFYGLKNGEWAAISSKITASVITGIDPSSPGTIDPTKVDLFEPVAVTPGDYDGIKIDIAASNSWAAISEITLISSKPNLPSAPLNLHAVGGNSKVDLAWNAVDNAKSYNVFRATTAGGPYTSIATNVIGTNYTDTSVNNGTTYYYVVTAINADGESKYSNEAMATPQAAVIPDPKPDPKPDPEQPKGNRAILVVTLSTGLEKEFDLSMAEVNAFIDWYEAKSNGIGSAKFAINKHNNNKGPFSSRKDYVIFDKILTFEVSEYNISK
ncbi:discoidin domain-containing protein [Paenibacillus sp. 481]|uniref:discoidin domain-containing protein n=1 Tax=Paenibacillus sp. 481 TaxID=2835869 RepID=UPI001E2CB692|nr:discoidin domain-containing protein [Paenibacillus sp. 481]UHA73844.1 discoidin domain-containing protein [Paenibacillus sp. 481]